MSTTTRTAHNSWRARAWRVLACYFAFVLLLPLSGLAGVGGARADEPTEPPVVALTDGEPAAEEAVEDEAEAPAVEEGAPAAEAPAVEAEEPDAPEPPAEATEETATDVVEPDVPAPAADPTEDDGAALSDPAPAEALEAVIAPMADANSSDIVIRTRTVAQPLGSNGSVGTNYSLTQGATFQAYTDAAMTQPVAGASCTVTAGGECTINVPGTGPGGDNNGRRLYIGQTAAADGTYSNPELRIGNQGGPTQVFRYVGQTLRLQANRTYTLPSTGSDLESSYGAVPNSVSNPMLAQTCESGISVAVVMDLSGSISSDDRRTFRNALTGRGGLFDALTGTGSTAAIFSFSNESPATDRTNYPAPMSIDDQRALLDSRVQTSSSGGTNWDRGLRVVADSPYDYDLVLFITDGAPNYVATSTNGGHVLPYPGTPTNVAVRSLEAAIYSANAVKLEGSRVIAVGVGGGAAGGVSHNLRAISGTTAGSDYYQGDWAGLNRQLEAIASAATCQVPVTVIKNVLDANGQNPQRAAGWDMTVGATQGTWDPAETTRATNQDGEVRWNLRFSEPNSSADITVSEAVQQGYVFDGGTCEVGGRTVELDSESQTLTGVEAGEAVTCTFNNRPGMQDLTIDKTVSGESYTQDWTWDIVKDVDPDGTMTNPADSPTEFTYTVTVTPTASAPHSATYTTNLVITNPNPFPVTGVELVDETCTVNEPTFDLAANETKEVALTCTADTVAGGTNTATISWTGPFGQSGTASDSAEYSFDGAAVDGQYAEVNVTDTFPEFAAAYPNATVRGDAGAETFTYTVTHTAPEGECREFVNTATIVETEQSDTAEAKVCSMGDVTVTKNVLTELDRTYTWSIDKSVDDTSILVDPATGTASAEYTVVVTEGAATDSNWTMEGTITVTNPNQFQDAVVTVTDATNVGGVCTVEDGVDATIPAGQSVEFAYSCLFTEAPTSYDGSNTATVTWAEQDEPSTYTANFTVADWDLNEWVKDTVVSDTFPELAEEYTEAERTLTWSEAGKQHRFTYVHEFTGTELHAAGECVTVDNTASLSTGGEDTVEVQVCAGKLTLTKVADKTEGLQVGETVTYTFTATNEGQVPLTNVTVVDTEFGGAGDLSALTCTPEQPATLAPGESMTCTATYVVQVEDLGKDIDNVATADSDETPPVTDDETVTTKQLGLTVKKDVEGPRYLQDYDWTITKTVDPDGTMDDPAASGTEFGYTVTVTPTATEKHSATYTTVLTVTNPNTFPVEGVQVIDANCTVGDDDTGFTVGAGESTTVTLECTAPSVDEPGTNQASITWNEPGSETPATASSNVVELDFTDATVVPAANAEADVTDTFAEFAEKYGEPTIKAVDGRVVYTYSVVHTAPVGECATFTNVANVIGDDGALDEDDTAAKVCNRADVEVTKNVITGLDRTYAWSIDKAVDDSSILVDPDTGTASAEYTVVVTEGAATDANWSMTGQITVTNPNQFQEAVVTVTDATSVGGVCTVVDGVDATIPAGESVTFDYSCLFTEAPASYEGSNVATVTWASQAEPATYTATFAEADWELTEFLKETVVTDTFAEFAEEYTEAERTLTWSEAGKTHTFTYTKVFSGDDVPSAGECLTVDNTARLSTGGSDTVEVEVCAGKLTFTKVADKTEGLQVGETVTYTFTATNEGQVPLTNVTVVDTEFGGAGELSALTCTPEQPATLAPGEAMTCTATYVVQVGDLGRDIENLATADSDETPPVTDDETVTTKQLDLTVAKAVKDSTFLQDYGWAITKTVSPDGTMDDPAASGTEFGYTVTVTPTATMKHSATYTTELMITNPNTFAVSNVEVTDANCIVGDDDTGFELAAGATRVVTLECSAPSVDDPGTNQASITWDEPGSDEAGTASSNIVELDFTDATAVPAANAEVDVTDTFAEFAEKYGEPTIKGVDGRVVYTYTIVHTAPVGECADFANVAKVIGDDGVLDEDDTAAKVCNRTDVEVTKNVITGLDRTYAWSIDKSVDDSSILVDPATGTASAEYTVVVTEGAATDANWSMTGQITVTNPNRFQDAVVTVTDATSVGGVCTVADGVDATIPAGESVTFDYSCLFTEAPASYDGTNVATVTWASQAEPSTYTATFAEADWELTEFLKETVVTDTFAEFAEEYTEAERTLTWTEAGRTHTFTYVHEFVMDELPAAGECVMVENTASLSTGGSDTVEVEVCAGKLTFTKVADKTAGLQVGETVTYTFTATNEGQIPLTNVTITDTEFGGAGDLSALTCTPEQPATLAPGEAMTCTATYVVQVGDLGKDIENLATADSDETPPVTDDETVTTKQLDLTVAKAVKDPTYLQDHDWTITKTVSPDGTMDDPAASGTEFSYVVKVTSTATAKHSATYTTELTITNPNTFAVSNVEVTDVNCTVGDDDTGFTLAAGATKVVTLECTAPSVDDPGTNQASITWDKPGTDMPGTASSNVVELDFTDATAVPAANAAVDVTDTFAQFAEKYGEPTIKAVDGKVVYTYTVVHTAPVGECATFTNVAKVIGDDGVLDEDDTAAKVCNRADVTVTKNVITSLDRTYAWSIDKSVDDDMLYVDPATGEATAKYTITVTEGAHTDANWLMTGTITVTNPNRYVDAVVDVTDATSIGGECVVVDGDDATIPAGESVEFTYACTWDEQPTGYDGSNVATVTWAAQEKPSTYTANFVEADWELTEFLKETVVTDTFAEFAEEYTEAQRTLTWTKAGTVHEFTYTKVFSGDEVPAAGECLTVDNTARLSTGGEDTVEVELCMGKLTLTKTASPAKYDAVGQVITYTLTAENTGQIPLYDVTITDAKLGLEAVPCADELAPGETCTVTETYTITQADLDAGSVHNAASTTGTDPGDNPVTDDDDETVPGEQKPAIDIVKMVDAKGKVKVGETLLYTFKVTNTGNVTLTDVTVTDPKLAAAGIGITCPATELAPGASMTCTADKAYTVTLADVKAGKVHNVATVTGEDPGGKPVKDDDDVTVETTVTKPPVIVKPPKKPTKPKPVIPSGAPEGLGPNNDLVMAGAALLTLAAGAGAMATTRRRRS